MRQWGIYVPDEMDDAVRRLADERGATLSNFVRMIVADYLAEHGEKVESKVKWGGNRRDRKNNKRSVDS